MNPGTTYTTGWRPSLPRVRAVLQCHDGYHRGSHWLMINPTFDSSIIMIQTRGHSGNDNRAIAIYESLFTIRSRSIFFSAFRLLVRNRRHPYPGGRSRNSLSTVYTVILEQFHQRFESRCNNQNDIVRWPICRGVR